MQFDVFVYEQGIIGVTIGTMFGFAVNNLLHSLNEEVIFKLLDFMKIKNAWIISSIIEFLIVLLIIYFLYLFVLVPLFKEQIKKTQAEKSRKKMWRQELLDEVKDLDYGTVYIS
jgi:large-conductance mechanosensitive channel